MASTELANAALPPPPSMLVGMYIEKQQRGWSLTRIADYYKQPVEDVYAAVQDYYSSTSRMSDAEYRMLQLERLERMIDAVWDLAIETKSLDHIDTLLSILKEISKLLGLNKQKAITEIQVIDARQQTLVVNYVDAVSTTLLNRVLNVVTAKGARSQIEQAWDAWVADAAKEPLKMIEQAKVKV